MRTTVTLDADAEHIVRERMRAKGVSFKKALNDSIRDGAAGRTDFVFVSPTYSMGAELVDTTKALQLAADLEDAELMRKSQLGS